MKVQNPNPQARPTPRWLRQLEIVLNRIADDAGADLDKGLLDNAEKYVMKYNAIRRTLTGKGVRVMSLEARGIFEYGSAILTQKAQRASLGDVHHEARTLAQELEFLRNSQQEAPVTALARIERICSRFHAVVAELRKRHNNRDPFLVQDEYDVQDLMRGLLSIDFGDIRSEEWTPSYAGGSSRMDVLLKPEQIVVEIKKTRSGLGAAEVGVQLLIDIVKYKSHPDCKTLVCFVYDPEQLIKNPRGIVHDLEGTSRDLPVRVLVRPTGE